MPPRQQSQSGVSIQHNVKVSDLLQAAKGKKKVSTALSTFQKAKASGKSAPLKQALTAYNKPVGQKNTAKLLASARASANPQASTPKTPKSVQTQKTMSFSQLMKKFQGSNK